VDHCKVHLTEGQISIFDDIRQMQHVASTLVFNQTTVPTTLWDRDQKVVQYKSIQLKIKNLVSGARSMLATLNRKMHDLSGGKPVKYIIPANHVDDLSSTARGKSWLQSAHTEPRDQALMHSMDLQGLWNLSRPEDGTMIWNMTACRDFMRKAAEIVDLMITLVHIGSGPPLRGEELIRDQVTNGIQPRTLYLVFGQMVAIRRHSKDTHARRMDPFNVCYFPQSLTDAICYYLLVIRPLEKLVAHQLYQDPSMVQQYDLFLYVKHGKRMTSPQFSATLEKLTLEHIKTRLTLQPCRQLLVGVQKAYVPEILVEKANNIGDLASSHSTETAETRYAVEFGQPENKTAEHLLKVQEWCDNYHDTIGLGDPNHVLVPLRSTRRLTRVLGGIASMAGSEGHTATVQALLPIVMELMASAHRSAMEDLKPFVKMELQRATSDALKYLVEAGGATSGFSQTLEQPPGNRVQDPQPPVTRPTKPLPSKRAPAPSCPTVIPGQGRMQAKRRLLSGEQQQPKRQSRATTPSTERPEPDNEDVRMSPFDDGSTEDQGVSIPAVPQHLDQRNPLLGSTTEPGTSSSPAVALPTPEVEVDSTTLLELSVMHIESSEAQGQTDAQATEQEASQVEEQETSRVEEQETSRVETLATPPADQMLSGGDPSQGGTPPLEALRKLRRSLSAVFKSPAQEELVQNVLQGHHTVAVLPTGGGKSLAYELPPVCQGRVTIAVFPFKVIASQAAQMCTDRGVAFHHWVTTDYREINDKRLVIMAVETILTAAIIE
jgi:hypothetical protein